MPFLENLLEGFAGAANDTGTVNRIEDKKSDRRATEHEELEANTKSILSDVQGYQDRKAKLDPSSPTYKKDAADIDTGLAKAQQTLTDLYHPAKNPGALDKLAGFIKSHLGQGPQPQAPSITPAEARQKMSARIGELNAGAAAPNPEANPITKEQRQMREAGYTPEQIAHAQGMDPKDPHEKYQLQTTTDADGKQHTWRVPMEAGGKAEEVTFDGQQPAGKGAGAASKPVRAWTRKGGKIVSVLIDPKTNKMIPGSENPEIMPPSTMSGRVSTGFYHYVDADGNVHQVAETKTSGPAGGGSIGPKEARDKAAKLAPNGGASGDKLLGHKGSASETKARNEYNDAVKLSSIADQVSKNPNDAVNQKRLAVALERTSAGRFTVQALDYIIKAGWGNTIEGWANSATTGALPADVMRQLIDGAHQNKQAAFEALQEARKPIGDSAPSASTGSSGKAVSLAKARSLPQNKGKSDAEIRKDIESHGHTVTD